jgi:hypothetical protein
MCDESAPSLWSGLLDLLKLDQVYFLFRSAHNCQSGEGGQESQVEEPVPKTPFS